jgi:hypothetical protein
MYICGFNRVVPRMDTPKPPIPYTNYFCLNTSGSNLYIFATPSGVQCNTWVNSIRLSSWEIAKLCQLFTSRLLARQEIIEIWIGFGVEPFATLENSQAIAYEGVVMVNFGYSDEWRMLFAVVSSVVVFNEAEGDVGEQEEDSTGKMAKKLFFKQKTATKKRESNAGVGGSSRHGTILFYRSKKEQLKRARPLFHIPYVRAAYALWPETPDAPACLGKMECSVLSVPKIPVAKEKKKKGEAEVVPEFEFGAFEGLRDFLSCDDIERKRPSSQHIFFSVESGEEMMKWIVAVTAAFNIESGGFDGAMTTGCVGVLQQEMVPFRPVDVIAERLGDTSIIEAKSAGVGSVNPSGRKSMASGTSDGSSSAAASSISFVASAKPGMN